MSGLVNFTLCTAFAIVEILRKMAMLIGVKSNIITGFIFKMGTCLLFV